MKKYDVFLFDADGTLYDYDKAEENALRITFEKNGVAYSEDIRNRYREINAGVWESFENGEITKDDLQSLRFQRLFDCIGVRLDAVEFNGDYLYELGKGAFLIDGALEICEYIASRGKKIYIVTNGILATQTSRIKHSLINGYVADFFVSEFVGYQKPHASYFDYVFSHIPHAGKSGFLIIGDSLAADIQGGVNAGIDSCWFNERNAKNRTGIKPTYEIRKLSELRQFI